MALHLRHDRSSSMAPCSNRGHSNALAQYWHARNRRPSFLRSPLLNLSNLDHFQEKQRSRESVCGKSKPCLKNLQTWVRFNQIYVLHPELVSTWCPTLGSDGSRPSIGLAYCQPWVWGELPVQLWGNNWVQDWTVVHCTLAHCIDRIYIYNML